MRTDKLEIVVNRYGNVYQVGVCEAKLRNFPEGN